MCFCIGSGFDTRAECFWRECRNQGIHQNMSIFRRTNFLWEDVLHVFHYDTWASESRPERVRLCVHTTEPSGPVPEPFHCDHIARWSARSGTTRRSGRGVNTGTRLRSGPVPVPKLWCEHGLRPKSPYQLTGDSVEQTLDDKCLIRVTFCVTECPESWSIKHVHT